MIGTLMTTDVNTTLVIIHLLRGADGYHTDKQVNTSAVGPEVFRLSKRWNTLKRRV